MLIWTQSYSQWFSVHLAAVNGAGFLLMCNGKSHAGKDGWRILRKSLFCHGASGWYPRLPCRNVSVPLQDSQPALLLGIVSDPDFPNVHNRLDRTPHELAVLK